MERAKSFSEIKGDRAFDAFAEILPPIFSIAADPEAVEAFSGEKSMSRLERLQALIRVCGKHREAFLKIEAVKRGCLAPDVEMSMDDILNSATELMNDPLFICFFVLAQRDETSAISAPDHTEGQPA